MTRVDVRTAAAAFGAAMLVALVFDAVMQLSIEAVRVSSFGSPPWWITANIIERGRWVALAALLGWLAPRALAPGAEGPRLDAAEIWRLVGLGTIALPLLWIGATWIVSALRFTFLGSWSTEGQVFLSAGYYQGLAFSLAPWVMGGAAVLAIRRHL